MPSQDRNRKVVLNSNNRIVYDPLAESYFSRTGVTDQTERNAVNTLFLTFRDAPSIINSLQGGFLYLNSPTNIAASLFNAMSNNFTLTAPVAFPDYSVNGWSFNGTNQYFNTGFNCATNLTLNTGFMYVYNRTNVQNPGSAMSASASTTSQWQMVVRNTSDQAKFHAYNSTGALTVANTNSSGHFVFSITASNNRFIRRNGVSLGTSSSAVGGTLPSLNLYLGARNNNGTVDAYVPYEIASAACGTIGLSTADADIFYNAMATYNSTVISGGR